MTSFSILKAKTPLHTKIMADKRIIKLFRMKEKGVYAIDTNELIEELTDLHQARRFRNFKPDEFLQSTQKNLVAWELELASTRSRALYIKMSCFKIKRQLEEQIKNTKGYVLTTYANELKEEISTTITGRKNYVDLLLESFRKLDYKLDTAIQLSDMLISDLTESKWNASGIIETLKIAHGRD